MVWNRKRWQPNEASAADATANQRTLRMNDGHKLGKEQTREHANLLLLAITSTHSHETNGKQQSQTHFPNSKRSNSSPSSVMLEQHMPEWRRVFLAELRFSL